MYGDVYLDSFKEIPAYADSFVVKYSTIVMSISQVSETLFILAIPFFLKVWNQKSNDLFYDCMGVTFRIICLWKSRRWLVDDLLSL